MFQQMKFFGQDVNRMLGRYKIRIIHVWLSSLFWGILLYRVERGMYLLIGKPYQYIRILFVPVINLILAYSNCDIHYKADIKGGILILHNALGVVISGLAQIGSNITLAGGNVIGARPGTLSGDIIIGDDCIMGANAVILGPIKLANRINVGAMACVVNDCESAGATLVGVPAKMI